MGSHHEFFKKDDKNDHIDRICDQFEQALKDGQSPRIEEYLKAIEESFQDTLFAELLLLEIWYYPHRGGNRHPADYESRFPNYLVTIREYFFPSASLHETRPMHDPSNPKDKDTPEGSVDHFADYDGDKSSSNKEFVHMVAEQNVRATVEDRRAQSPILKQMEADGDIKIVGGIYAMESGEIQFLDE